MKTEVKIDTELIDKLEILSEKDNVSLENLIEVAIINLLIARGQE